jgi:membrane protein YdbS with pleckstrin-like domain
VYSPIKSLVLRVLRAPAEPPEPPAGSHASVQVFRASPRYLSYRLLAFWLGVAVLWLMLLVFAVSVGLSDEPLWALLALPAVPILIVLQFFGYFAARLDYELRYYIVTDRSIRVRHGALIVQEKTVSHANVQNLRVVQGPLQRLFRISTLRVDTAGGGASAGKGGHGLEQAHGVELAGIENAHAVRDLVLDHLRKRAHGAGLGDLDDREAARAAAPAPVSAAASDAMIAALGAVRSAAAALRHAAEAAR